MMLCPEKGSGLFGPPPSPELGGSAKATFLFCILHLTGRVEKQQKCYLKKENNVPDESKDNGGISVCNISRIDADQLNLKEA